MHNTTITETKTDRLRIMLKESLHEEVTVNTHHYGIKTFTIGDMPAWHKDQLVHPVMTALTKMAAEQEREKKEAATKAKEVA